MDNDQKLEDENEIAIDNENEEDENEEDEDNINDKKIIFYFKKCWIISFFKKKIAIIAIFLF